MNIVERTIQWLGNRRLVTEKAKSKKQQRLFGMVHSVQKYGMPAPSKKVAAIAKSISPKEAEKFAKTKRSGLPEKVKKSK